jgi:hypothetical protein
VFKAVASDANAIATTQPHCIVHPVKGRDAVAVAKLHASCFN